MTLDWTAQLNEQLTWHWDHHVWPRLVDLTDDEYFWEPVEGCWSIRPRRDARTAMAAGAGELVIDFEYPEPSPPPVTTIAWRLGHVLVGLFGLRTASHFGGPPINYQSAEWPADAAAAVAAVEKAYRAWIEGVSGLDESALGRPVGPAEGPFAELPMATLVLHINREAIHHLAEVLLLQDLYRAQP
jgi:hypothetical protein